MALRAASDYAFCSLASLVMSFHVMYQNVGKSMKVLQPTKISVIQKMQQMQNTVY